MGKLVTVLVLGCYLSAVLAELPHYTVYKSFETALYECAEYFQVPNCTVQKYIRESFPDDREVQVLIRCTLINLGGWDDSIGGRDYVLRNFFAPSADDKCYERRTRECIYTTLDSLTYYCPYRRAYETFRCYYRYYGELITSGQYIPKELNELQQLALTGLIISNLPQDVLIQYCRGDIMYESNFPQLLYLLLIRGGYYSCRSGFRLDNLYTQVGDPILLDPQTQQCIDGVAREKCNADEVTRVHQSFVRCLSNIFPLVQYVQEAAKTLVGDGDGCICSNALYNGN
ncbi:general odorant-binding protein 45-like [Topomyia yanbarensis]|uniref:general odorant-binding protein 45-like n=1 Tax=Topomyia yanbarensis TaxID=2498891 RepID=UPI00273C6C36|nr:general odorant-binding protein 45-like [Topomyia yanbarensis]XP_058840659.1 general odorant-binding protein 45-like [Topomyia yanbarensis]